MDILTLKEALKNLKDPRRTSYGNIRHKMEDILIIGLCTVICGGEDFVDMEEFGKEREEFLRNFLGLELPNGIPDSDTFRRFFERLNPSELSSCLNNWIAVERNKRSVIPIDGKTIGGSANNEHKAYHVVSAFVAENQITLGEITVAEKSNEITAVPELLDLIDIEGAIVTADAMSCQRKIVAKIVEKDADYIIGLKGNQPELYKDAEESFEEFGAEASCFETLDKGHGRIESRKYRLLTNLSWVQKKEKWSGLKALGEVTSFIMQGDKSHECTRYFITSLTDVQEFASSVRKHWSIENQLHWCLDVVFREDAARNRKGSSPLNMNVLRKVALSLVTQAQYGRVSKKKMMFKAALSPNLLLRILFGGKK